MKRYVKIIGVLLIVGITFGVFFVAQPTLAATTVYQAESGTTRSGAIVETEHAGYTGSGYVNFEPNAAGGWIQWTVNVQAAGNTTLQFRFANGTSGNRPASISVNGSTVITGLAFNGTGSWTTWNIQQTTVTLNAGNNTVRLTGTGSSGGANIDSLTVIDSGTGTVTPTPTPTTPGVTPTPTQTPGGQPNFNLVGYATVNGATTGGQGGQTVTVSNAANLETYAGSTAPYIIRVSGIITVDGQIEVAPNKTIIGVGSNSGITGGGLELSEVSNIIIRNMNFSFPVGTDSITIERGTHHVWIDHNDFQSDRNHGIDYYDGLLDITRESDYITVSWNRFRNHFKGSLIGHSDSHTADSGHLHVTYHHNWFNNIAERQPSLRFGTGHLYNNYHQIGDNGINSRMGAQVLVENSVFRDLGVALTTALYSDEEGYAVHRGNDFGNCPINVTQVGSFTQAPYAYSLEATSTVVSSVTQWSGTGVIG